MLASPIKRRSDARSVRGPVTRPCLSHWPTHMALPVEVAGDVTNWSAVRDWTVKSREVRPVSRLRARLSGAKRSSSGHVVPLQRPSDESASPTVDE